MTQIPKHPPSSFRSSSFQGRAVASSALLSLIVAACSSGGSQSTPSDADSESEIYASSYGLFRSPAGSRETPIQVCFENGDGWATEIGWVQDALESTWDAASGVDFQGFGKCGRGIRVRISDSGPRVEGGLGRVADKVFLNFTFNNWSTSCRSTREFCIRSIAIHEFGHALGFAHEANRPDSECSREQGSDGDVRFKYDPDSVMNYCEPYRTTLSPLDTDGVRRTYGWVPVRPGVYGVMHNTGYLAFSPATSRSRAPESIGVYSSLSTIGVAGSGSGTLTYGGVVTLSNAGYFLGIPAGAGGPRGPAVALAAVSSRYEWRIEPASNSDFGRTVDTREPVTLSTVAAGRKYYLSATISRPGAGPTLALAQTANAAAEWRFIGPIEMERSQICAEDETQCGDSCCGSGARCADASASLCCGTFEELCGGVCCPLEQSCISGTCQAPPPPPPSTTCGAVPACSTIADCPSNFQYCNGCCRQLH